MLISVKNIAWLAGFLEGEGSFLLRGVTPTISVAGTDKDIIHRAAQLMKSHTVNVLNPKNPKYKTQYYCQLYSSRAIAWMMTMYCLLGERRREKVLQIIEFWKHHESQKNKGRKPRARIIPNCHPDRKHEAHGQCRQCYLKTPHMKEYMRLYRMTHPKIRNRKEDL